MQLLETPGVLGRGRNSDKEIKKEFPCITHDSDIVQPSPCYQQGAWIWTTHNLQSYAARMLDAVA